MVEKIDWMNTDSDKFWNYFSGAWGCAQTLFSKNPPEQHESWLFMQTYVKDIEQKLKEYENKMLTEKYPNVTFTHTYTNNIEYWYS